MTGLRRFHNKRDANEAELVDYMRKRGLSVHLMDKPCDALVGWRDLNYLVDFKGKKGKLTANQMSFNAFWKGSKIAVIRSIEDVDAWMLQEVQNDALRAVKTNTQRRTLTASA